MNVREGESFPFIDCLRTCYLEFRLVLLALQTSRSEKRPLLCNERLAAIDGCYPAYLRHWNRYYGVARADQMVNISAINSA